MATASKVSRRIAAYDRSLDGHRSSYLKIAQKLLGAKALVGTEGWSKTKDYEEVIYFTFDDYFRQFIWTCLIRKLRGQKTYALSLRLEMIQEKLTFKRWLKRAVLKLLSRAHGVAIVSLSPPWLVPGLEDFTTDWVEDLQLWDLSQIEFGTRPRESELKGKAVSFAAGRKIVLALGRQDLQKGLDFFLELSSHPLLNEEFAFVIVGELREIPSEMRASLMSKCLVIDEYLEESDLISCYSWADYIWACYQPSYNVNSGIFGRAVQLGKRTLVRQGSLLAKIQIKLGQGLSLPYASSDAVDILKHGDSRTKASNTLSIQGAERFIKVFSSLNSK